MIRMLRLKEVIKGEVVKEQVKIKSGNIKKVCLFWSHTPK